MNSIKLEAIISWILIALAIAIAVWLLIGSPPATNSLLTIIIFITASEILIWRALYKIDKLTTVSFVKLKSDINMRFNRADSRLENIGIRINKNGKCSFSKKRI